MKQALNHLTMSQLTRIQENQYRSADCTVDYCPFEVEQRIIEIKMKQAQKMLKLEEVAPVIEIDSQLSGLMAVTMPAKHLLALIDVALKNYKKNSKIVEVEIEIENKETGAPGIFSIEADVLGDHVEFDWSTGGAWYESASGSAFGPCDYEISKYQEECLIDLALNAEIK